MQCCFLDTKQCSARGWTEAHGIHHKQAISQRSVIVAPEHHHIVGNTSKVRVSNTWQYTELCGSLLEAWELFMENSMLEQHGDVLRLQRYMVSSVLWCSVCESIIGCQQLGTANEPFSRRSVRSKWETRHSCTWHGDHHCTYLVKPNLFWTLVLVLIVLISEPLCIGGD